jgi:hypothetical protein
MVPLFAGVIIAGLGIGALLSAFAARRLPAPSPAHSAVVVLHTPTPVARTAAPERVAQNATATPESTPTVSPTPVATRKATPTSAPTGTPRATIKPAPTIKPTAKPSAAIATVAPTAAITPRRVAEIPEASRAERQAVYAQELVRRFLSAVANGDDQAAYSALGGNSGSLSEAQYLDPTLRITSMTSSHNTSGGTDVQVEMRTAKGQYFGTFSVNAGGTRITQREIIPVAGTTAR